jgi:hypothetical protein
MDSEQNREIPKPVNRARRHFFQVLTALAGAAVFPALSHPAKARGGGNGDGNSQGGGGGGHCLLRGTRIQTCRGPERVENLSIGDLVVTTCGEVKRIKWVGRWHFTQRPSSGWPENVHPIRVNRSALADNVPQTDLYLSPMHAVYIDGALIQVKDLVNGTSINPGLPDGVEDIEYFHIELENHQVILAEGAPVETLLTMDGGETLKFVENGWLQWNEARPAMVPYAPVFGYSRGREHLKALLRLGVSQVIDIRDPIQIAYDRIAARATNSYSSP